MSDKPFKRMFFILQLLLALMATVSNAQKNLTYEVVSEGQGIGNIRAGSSTKADVVNNYGSGFRTITHGDYEYEMFYEKLRLSFYYCQSDKKEEISAIEIIPPYNVKTDRGITLSESTRNDVLMAYNVANTEDELRKHEVVSVFPGIKFIYSQEVVGSIKIFEMSGLRNCNLYPVEKK